MKDLKYYLDKACNTATVRIDPQSLPDKADHKIIECICKNRVDYILQEISKIFEEKTKYSVIPIFFYRSIRTIVNRRISTYCQWDN